MEYKEIDVPRQVNYLSQWQELLTMLPENEKYILNKVNTGCGGTTLFLESPQPCIIVSPRSNVLYSKSEQFPNAHLFRNKTDTSTSVPELKRRLSEYISYKCNFGNSLCPWERPKQIIPKILVTVDSYPYVAEQLEYMNILSQFTVLVDEFQCLLSDSKFKGHVDLEFLHNLYGIRSVCYMSATPIDEAYINEIPDFSDVSTYYKLIWDSSALWTPNLDMRTYRSKQSSKSICKGIIDDYKENRYFASKIINGSEVRSTEVVIFLNDVKTIVQVISENNLDPNEVNVLCSSSNKYVSVLKSMKVHVGELTTDPNNPVNRTFTFVTQASFEGVDFYSTSAFTYIFSDGVLAWNRHDLIIDIPQILGRQRLNQPFRKDAVLYYRANSMYDINQARDLIKQKEDKTRHWIDKYFTVDDEVKKMLKDGIDKRSDKSRYADDYLEFVDNLDGSFTVRENSLLKYAEIRDWQLASYVYNSPTNIARTLVDNTNINVTSNIGYNTLSGQSVLDRFLHDFHKATTFPEKMRIYIDMRTNCPEYDEDLHRNAFIDIHFHKYFEILGANRIKTLRYRAKDIEKEMAVVMQEQKIRDECGSIFQVGNRYLVSEVKVILQKIYKKVGVNAVAKASDIEKYMPSATQRQLTTPATKKRELYYEIRPDDANLY